MGPAVLVGSALPVMVMFGLHNGVAPLGVMQMANLGYDSIFGPGCVLQYGAGHCDNRCRPEDKE